MRALAALVGVSLALAAGYAFMVWAKSVSPIGLGSAAALTFQVAFLVGLIPVAIYGAPLYTWLQRKHLLTWPRVVILGALPGVVLVPFEWSFGAVAVPCGVAVSSLTHGFAKKDSAGAL
jgi:hypothetical protein